MKTNQSKDINQVKRKSQLHIFIDLNASILEKKAGVIENNHSYMIIDKLDFPVFEKDDWSLMQEMEFIKGIEK